jgi:hypothetical protein
MGKRYIVRLSKAEQECAERLANDTTVAKRMRAWASILLAAHAGLRDQEIAVRCTTSVATVQRTRQRYALEGFHAALGKKAEDVSLQSSVDATTKWLSAILQRSQQVDGIMGAAIVDLAGQTCLGHHGSEKFDVLADALASCALVQENRATLQALRLPDAIEDIAVTSTTRYHLIRVLPQGQDVLWNVIVDRRHGNLALARHQMEAIERSLVE